MLRRSREQAQCGQALKRGLRQERGPAWERAVGPSAALALALACVYFVAARLGMALPSTAAGMPALWPASGVAAGALIALAGRGRGASAAGILAATVASGLVDGLPVLIGLWLGVCNAGEALLTAGLVDRWCGRPFRFHDWHGLWGFLAAAALASGTAGFGTALAMQQLPGPVSFPDAWRVWAAADGLGIVIVAPLLVGLHRLAAGPMARNEALEGAAALGLLAAASAALYAAPPGSFLADVPPAVLFPFLLWITARCPPVVAAAAVVVISAALIWAATLRPGRLGDADLAVHAIQTMLLVGALCTLTLSVLFAERRRNEAALRDSAERLRLALGGAELGVWSVDLATDAFDSDERDRCINGHDPAAPPRTLTEVRRLVHPEDLPRLDAAFAAARLSGAPCRAEYRVLPAGRCAGAPDRWVAVEGSAVRDAAGRPVRLLGVTRDITERKRDEEHKSLLVAELDHRVKNVLAVVSALLARTRDIGCSVAELAAALDGRIKSMATAHELLSGRKWQGVALADLIERLLAPYAAGGSAQVGGPDVVLVAEAGQALAMVVHELVTNAAKYGALSVQDGRVTVRWRLVPESGSGAHLALDWQETGGPAVSPSSRIGYGTSVIRDLVPYELGGTADLAFPVEGVRCRLEIPARWLAEARPDPPSRPARATLLPGSAAERCARTP